VADQTVAGPVLREELRKRRNDYLRRLTRWERTATTDDGVVQVRRRFANSKEAPLEAPFETDERRAIEKRYSDYITSYGDWESLRIVRNELNLNRLTAWLVWLKEESIRDSTISRSNRNPFRTELLPNTPPIFGPLPPNEHLPPLDRPAGFGGVVFILRKCGASLTNDTLAAVFQAIAGVQTLRVTPQSAAQGSEEEVLLPTARLSAEIGGVVKGFEDTQAIRTPSLGDEPLDAKIWRCLQEARPSADALFASGRTLSSHEEVGEAVLAAWGSGAGDLLTDISINFSPAAIGELLEWLSKIYQAAKSPARHDDSSPPVGGWEPPPQSGWEKPPIGGWEKPPISGWEPPPRAGWDPPRVAPDRWPAWRRAVQAIETLASLERLNRRTLADALQDLAKLVLITFGWPADSVIAWLDDAARQPGAPLRVAALLEYPGVYAAHIHGTAEFQFPPYTPLGVRWCANVLIPSTIGHILALKETADFHVTDHLRFVLLFDAGRLMTDTEVLPGEIRPFFEGAIVRFKFCIEDAHSSGAEEMTFWSENHQVLFASCEFLAGQHWPDREFPYADGAGAGHPGSWHRERGRKRLHRWLADRLKLGFSEWNAPGYYNEDVPPLLNVADFSRDVEIVAMARTVLDLIVFDLARFTCQGNFGVTAGRVYLEHKRVAWDQSVGDFVELLFGTRGDVLAPNETTAIAFATSSYVDQVPEVLLAIGRDRSSNFTDNSRVSEDLGPIDPDNPDDIMFWWGNGGYFTTQTWDATVKWAQRWNLLNSGPFKALKMTGDDVWERLGLALAGRGASSLLLIAGAIMPFPLNIVLIAVSLPGVIRGILDTLLAGVDVVLEFIEDVWDTVIGWFGADTDDDDAPRLSRPAVLEIFKRLLVEFNSGSVLSTACLRTFRTADVMLSSAVSHRPGEVSFQKQTCMAVVGQNVAVWTTKPLGQENTAEGFGRGVLNMISRTPVDWATTIAFPWASRPYDGLAEVALPFVGGSFLPGNHDGPNWWTGSVTLPAVWQVDNVAIQFYKPRDMQRSLSKNITHAWFPKHAFDEIRWEPSGDGMWVMGRRDRRVPPENPRNPADAPISDDGRNRKVKEETLGSGSGYVALYSAKPLAWAGGDFTDRELEAEDHENVFVTIVGDQAMFGSFAKFADAVLGCGVSASVGDMTCSLRIPAGSATAGAGRHFEAAWGSAKVDGVHIQTHGWPRFENRYVHGDKPGRVEAAERRWRISIPPSDGTGVSLELFHDVEHPERRTFNRQVHAAVAAAPSKRDTIRGGRRLRELVFSRK
jgi:hypothetical protein